MWPGVIFPSVKRHAALLYAIKSFFSFPGQDSFPGHLYTMGDVAWGYLLKCKAPYCLTYCHKVINFPHFQGKTPSLGACRPGVTWPGVFCQGVELYTTLLSALKFSFLEDAFNFLGCHQHRLLQVCYFILRNQN